MSIPRDHCVICGAFCRWADDNSTSFASGEASEPPDPDYYCRKCARKEERSVKTLADLPVNWIPARWEQRAAARIGAVRVNAKGCAWGRWALPNAIPEGYEVIL